VNSCFCSEDVPGFAVYGYKVTYFGIDFCVVISITLRLSK
jgi:hypothetical protein